MKQSTFTGILLATAMLMSSVAQGADYRVVRGDTLAKIGRLHGVSYQQIMSFNGMTKTTIFPGQVLRIPGSAPAVEVTSVAPAVTVPAYEAPAYNAPVEPAPQPVTVSAPVSTESYTVQPGDSVWAISRKFDVSSWSLRKANDIRFSNIYPGQVLAIPLKPANNNIPIF